MRTGLVLSALAALASTLGAADKPRIFITESQAMQLSGEASVGETKGALSLMGGTSPQNIEVMKHFTQRCPGVIVTSNRDKAEYIVRFDHESIDPGHLFVGPNKVAVFNQDEDLIYSGSTRRQVNAVKNACAAIVEHAAKNR